MKNYTVRPYFGHDCNSSDGFNNGHYLDAIKVVADNESDAIGKAMDWFKDTRWPEDAEVDGSFGDGTVYWEFGHVWIDEHGTEYNDESDIPLDPDADGQQVETECHYLYQYIDFNDVQPVDDDITYDQEPEINPDR